MVKKGAEVQSSERNCSFGFLANHLGVQCRLLQWGERHPSFDVTDKNTGRATTIPYADVEKVQGSGLSKGAKIGIIAGVAVVTFVVVIAVALKSAGY